MVHRNALHIYISSIIFNTNLPAFIKDIENIIENMVQGSESLTIMAKTLAYTFHLASDLSLMGFRQLIIIRYRIVPSTLDLSKVYELYDHAAPLVMR